MKCRRYVDVRKRSTGQVLIRQARWGADFFSRLRGMMFRARLGPGEALILAEAADSRLAVAIHMLFVPFPLAVVWIDSAGRVVDKVLALPWRPVYGPRAPAKYVLETSPDFLDKVIIGDELVFEDCPADCQ